MPHPVTDSSERVRPGSGIACGGRNPEDPSSSSSSLAAGSASASATLPSSSSVHTSEKPETTTAARIREQPQQVHNGPVAVPVAPIPPQRLQPQQQQQQQQQKNDAKLQFLRTQQPHLWKEVSPAKRTKEPTRTETQEQLLLDRQQQVWDELAPPINATGRESSTGSAGVTATTAATATASASSTAATAIDTPKLPSPPPPVHPSRKVGDPPTEPLPPHAPDESSKSAKSVDGDSTSTETKSRAATASGPDRTVAATDATNESLSSTHPKASSDPNAVEKAPVVLPVNVPEQPTRLATLSNEQSADDPDTRVSKSSTEPPSSSAKDETGNNRITTSATATAPTSSGATSTMSKKRKDPPGASTSTTTTTAATTTESTSLSHTNNDTVPLGSTGKRSKGGSFARLSSKTLIEVRNQRPRSFALQFNEVSVRAVAQWVALGATSAASTTAATTTAGRADSAAAVSTAAAAVGGGNTVRSFSTAIDDKTTLAYTTVEARFRHCQSCTLYGHYETECPERPQTFRSKSDIGLDDEENFDVTVEVCHGYCIEQRFEPEEPNDDAMDVGGSTSSRPDVVDVDGFTIKATAAEDDDCLAYEKICPPSLLKGGGTTIKAGSLVAWWLDSHHDGASSATSPQPRQQVLYAGIVTQLDKPSGKVLVQLLRIIEPANKEDGSNNATEVPQENGLTLVPMERLHLVTEEMYQAVLPSAHCGRLDAAASNVTATNSKNQSAGRLAKMQSRLRSYQQKFRTSRR